MITTTGVHYFYLILHNMIIVYSYTCTFSTQDCEEAERVAKRLGIKFNVVNFAKGCGISC